MTSDSDDPRARRHRGTGHALEDESGETPESDVFVDPTPTIELRIDAPAAGSLVEGGSESAPLEEPTPPPAADTGNFELPNWADPPTGQVPRVLLDQLSSTEGLPSEFRGPTWRQESERFEESADLSFLIPEEGLDETIAGSVAPPEEHPFEFHFDEVDETALDVLEADAEAWTPLFEEPSAASPGAAKRRRHAAHNVRQQTSSKRNLLTATLVGLVLGAVAICCFLLGSVATVALIAAAAMLASGELFAALQRVGYRPATLVGLIAAPAMVIGAYLHGPIGFVEVAGIAFSAAGAWALSPLAGDEPLVNLAITQLVISWVGIAAAFAGLMLAPSAHPHRHGVALVVGLLVCVVANDIGAYGVGSKLGRHKLAPKVSPGKTIEGAIGGTVLTILAAVLIVGHIHPFGIGSAVSLGIVVSVLAPVGDLLESRAKRDLGLKDMGSLLPAHGGLFDRVDAILFLLPVAFVLFEGLHLR